MSQQIFSVTGIADYLVKFNKFKARLEIDPGVTTTINSIATTSHKITISYASTPTTREEEIAFLLYTNIFNGIDEDSEVSVLRVIRNEKASGIVMTAIHDILSGFSPGSKVIDTSSNKLFVCQDNTEGSAVWKTFVEDSVALTGSAVDNQVCRFDGATGKLIKGSAPGSSVTYNDSGDFSVSGVYRIGSTDVVDVPQTLTNKTITATSNNVTANSLRTATNSVTVSSATAPSAGQVLTATSPTTAVWQAVSSLSNYQYEESDTVSSTTSTSFINKVELTTPSLEKGIYRLGYCYEVYNSSSWRSTDVRVTLDGETVAETSAYERNRSRLTLGGFVNRKLEGVVTATIDFRRVNGGTAVIRRARLEFHRIS